MDSNTFTTLVQTIQITVVTSLIFIGGLSSCLSLWVIPLTATLPPSLAARQFQQTFDWGGQYLQPSSRILGASLLFTTLLTSRLDDPVEAQKWKTWAALFFVLLIIAPYEIYAIFPTNDRVAEMEKELAKGLIEEDAAKKELKVLLKRWQFRNFGRVALPLIVGVGGIINLTQTG